MADEIYVTYTLSASRRALMWFGLSAAIFPLALVGSLAAAIIYLESDSSSTASCAPHDTRKEAPQETLEIEIKDETTDRLERIYDSCNYFERDLLPYVVQPEDITTTFDNIFLSKSTIDTIHKFTKLFLNTKQFTYGILAGATAPGILFYGLPGTGKTHLVRAIAKECGASVLNVSGAHVFQKWVGESEKMVQAIFTLARKLDPCIVFVDEADALFHARADSDMRWHRSVLAQLLQEWDGFATDASKWVLVILATNRPDELDEAVLRRVPRKIYIEPPDHTGREAILRIHLKDEDVAEDVDFRSLAARTPSFTGSDLKALCIATAYASAYDVVSGTDDPNLPQNNTFSAPASPTRRILQMKHFEMALEEISASTAIRSESTQRMREFKKRSDGSRVREQDRTQFLMRTVSDARLRSINDAMKRPK